MNNSRTINSMKNIFTGFMSQGIVYISGFINRMVFIRCLSAEYLGVNALFSNVLSLLSLAELGIGTAIVFALYKPLAEKDNKKIGMLMHFYAKSYKIIGIVVGILGLCLIPFLEQIIGSSPNINENIYVLYLIALFNVVLSYFFSYKSSLLNADQKNYILTSINSIVNVIQCILQCAILLLTKNYIFYLICQSICTLVYNIVISHIVDKKYSTIKNCTTEKLDEETKKSLFINIKALIITKISGVLVNSTDNIILSALKGLSLTGLSANYTLLTNTLNGVLTTIFNGINASVGNANATLDKENQITLFYIINFLNFWLYGWCTISFCLLANDIIKIFFGSQYLLSADIVYVMALNFYTVGMQNAVLVYYSTLGLFNYGKYLGILTGLINLVTSIILGRILGLFGILLATFISRLLTNLWYSPYALFKYGFKKNIIDYIKKYFYYMLQTAAILLALIFLFQLLEMNFIVKLCICIVFPNLMYIFINIKSNELNSLKTKIRWLLKRN